MLPVVRSKDGTLDGGIPGFFGRRMRRILPAYYAALVLSLSLIWITRNVMVAREWGFAVPAFEWHSLVAHVFLLHNLSHEWINKIDPPMWSIAVEWQIYFVFPFLVYVWRKFGILACVLASTIAGLLPHFALHNTFDYSYPHFVALFGFGMVSAAICYGRSATAGLIRERLPWNWLCYVPFIILMLLVVRYVHWHLSHVAVSDLLVGAGMAAFLLAVGKETEDCSDVQARSNCKHLLVRLLEVRPLVMVGTFSYSLYLIHGPVLAILNHILNLGSLSPGVKYSIMVVGGVSIAALASYLFFFAFERPFLRTRQGSEKAQVDAAQLVDRIS